MRGIPVIGAAGGIFEVFVPGLFLLLNIIGVLYFLPFIPEDSKAQLSQIISNPALSLIIAIGFGYLMGVILRIFRAEGSDKWSGKYLRTFEGNCKKGEKRSNLYGYENFPYIGWLGVTCQNSMPREVLDFYYDTWARFEITDKTLEGYKKESVSSHKLPNEVIEKLASIKGLSFRSRKSFLKQMQDTIGNSDTEKYEYQLLRYACLWGRARSNNSGRSYFNFCKTVLLADDKLTTEIYSRSSLSRYISGMFYALVMGIVLLTFTLLLQLILLKLLNLLLIFMMLVYFVAILAILQNLRYMRVSEAQTVFYSSFKNRDSFDFSKKSDSSKDK